MCCLSTYFMCRKSRSILRHVLSQGFFCNVEFALLESSAVNALVDVGNGTTRTEMWQQLRFSQK